MPVDATDSPADNLSPRRREIVEAAVVVAGRNGLRGLTHRAVDAEAGLPQGSCSAYFRTRLALLTVLVEHVARTLNADITHVTERFDKAQDPEVIAEAIVGLLSRWLSNEALLIVRAELMLEAIRTPELMAAYRPWRDRLLRVIQAAIVAQGRTEQEAIAGATAVVAACEGTLTSAMLEEPARRAAYVRETAGLVVVALAAHPSTN